LRSIEKRRKDFDARGVKLVAISVDPPKISRELCRRHDYTYTFLSDPNAELIRRYDLLHPKAGRGGTDIARPAEFLLDSDGVIRWRNLTPATFVRAWPETILKAIDDSRLAPSPR
jgi:peroxiredoxin